MASMRDWLKGPGSEKGRTVVVHCKAGKGRSGTSVCSYLISEEGWNLEDALTRFTSRRMRIGFGSGVSIPSQLRWIGYVDWWTKHGKIYVERQIEIIEVHVWGMRDGVKVAVEGYVEDGKVIKAFHTFDRKERVITDGESQNMANTATRANEKTPHLEESNVHADPSHYDSSSVNSKQTYETGADAVLFRPDRPIVLPTSDINIDFERRNKATYGLTMVTSVAHVWFNAFFESQYSSTSQPDSTKPPVDTTQPMKTDTLPNSGVFEIGWDAMDGIKGSARKGTRALDRLAVVWRALPESKDNVAKIITEPSVGQPVPEIQAADWKKASLKTAAESLGKDLGLRVETPSSANVSKASSTTDLGSTAAARSDGDSEAGVKAHGPQGEEHISHPRDHPTISLSEPAPTNHPPPTSNANGMTPAVDLGIEKMRSPISNPGMKPATSEDLPDMPGQLDPGGNSEMS